MFSVRLCTFETNSSSCHVLVIPKNQAIHIPKSVHLRYGGDFGWAYEKRYETLQYVYDACVDRGEEEVERLRQYLKRKGVEEIEFSKSSDVFSYGIDHSDEVPLEDLFGNENLLDRFIFGEDSYIQTGNDNDYDSSVLESYNYDENEVDLLFK